MAFIICVCAGCGEPGDPQGALALDPEIDWHDDELVVESGIEFQPSEAMLEALERGVDLQLQVVTRVGRRRGPLTQVVDERARPVEIRFLPLTEKWQLSHAGSRQTYPRLWLLLEALNEPRPYATGLTREMRQDGSWQIRIRVVFSRDALPSPMHLPSLFLRQWRLTTPWHTWQFDPS